MKNIFVGNLGIQATEESVRELFSSYGDVDGVHLEVDRNTGGTRGFAFVEMSSESDANRAIAQLNGVELKGRALTVNEARPKAWQGVPRMRPVEVPAPPSADETRTHGLDTGGAKIQIAATGAHTFDLDAIENRTVDIGGIEAHAVDLDGIVTVTARAIEIFGTREKAIRWLRTPLPPLSDRTPLSMLNTAEGIERIEEVLGRIEQGVW